jgi:CrcB protein
MLPVRSDEARSITAAPAADGFYSRHREQRGPFVEREPDIDAIEEAPVALVPAVDARELAAVFCGGFLGALARAALEQWLGAGAGSWPWATFVVNLIAAGLLGFAVAWLGTPRGGTSEHHLRTMYGRAFLATGVCGALSTFSTVMIELIHLYEHAGFGLACAYAGASVAGGAGALLLGMSLEARVPTRVPA